MSGTPKRVDPERVELLQARASTHSWNKLSLKRYDERAWGWSGLLGRSSLVSSLANLISFLIVGSSYDFARG